MNRGSRKQTLVELEFSFQCAYLVLERKRERHAIQPMLFYNDLYNDALTMLSNHFRRDACKHEVTVGTAQAWWPWDWTMSKSGHRPTGSESMPTLTIGC